MHSNGRRRVGEFLMPASVILSGVLLVVAFGFLINRTMRNDDAAATFPLPQPPALGDVTNAPTDQGVIPVPSPSLSASSPSPSASTTPPARRTTPPVDNGAVDIDRAGVPALVDLSEEGRLDWVHWGEQGTFALERASGGDFRILEGAPTAPRHRHELSPQRFRWSGGSPVERTDGTRTGIHTCGERNGFELSVPAGRTQRTLRLYVGTLAARGRLEARLSTGGGTRVTRLEPRDEQLTTAVLTVTYRAPRNGTLKLSWVTEKALGPDCAGVALQAATLR